MKIDALIRRSSGISSSLVAAKWWLTWDREERLITGITQTGWHPILRGPWRCFSKVGNTELFLNWNITTGDYSSPRNQDAGYGGAKPPQSISRKSKQRGPPRPLAGISSTRETFFGWVQAPALLLNSSMTWTYYLLLYFYFFICKT